MDAYARSRNFKEGAISRIGPYISRGVISTRKVYDHVKSSGINWTKAEKFIQELAWRDYWQLIWVEKENEIFSDLKHPQQKVKTKEIPSAIVQANTGIEAVDEAVKKLYQTGYMHNHMRMYIAAICCNIAQCHWMQSSKWLYKHLLDGDLASNSLSWQWVAGSNSNKKYYANQDNINKYFNSEQKGTFIDVSYDNFEKMTIPNELIITESFTSTSVDFTTYNQGEIEDCPTCIYNYYNLDYNWHKTETMQRILLIEPSLFDENPISQLAVDFMLNLSKNIENIKVFVGNFESLQKQISSKHIYYKEHPLNKHYQGIQESRDWISSVKGYYPSFFSYWKKCKKEIKW